MPCDRRLRRRERITEEHEYKQVINKGTALQGRHFRAYLLIDGTGPRKAGFIAGRGVGNACQRNRARRLLREAYRDLKSGARQSGFGVVFVARRGIAEAGLREVAADMRKVLESASLIPGTEEGGSPRCE